MLSQVVVRGFLLKIGKRVFKIQMPDGQNIKAGRILEINPNHQIFTALQSIFEKDKEKVKDYASLLYDQALLIEGFSIDNPVDFSNKICDLMIELNK